MGTLRELYGVVEITAPGSFAAAGHLTGQKTWKAAVTRNSKKPTPTTVYSSELATHGVQDEQSMEVLPPVRLLAGSSQKTSLPLSQVIVLPS